MDESPITATVREICAKDKRYRPEAYYFMLDALDFTARMLDKAAKQGPERHVTGKELVEGIRVFALQEYGPMALTVLNAWGLTTTVDFGNIVFNLVESGKLRKTDQDQREDFAGGYDFQEVFAGPFLPKGVTDMPSSGKASPRGGGKRAASERPPDGGERR